MNPKLLVLYQYYSPDDVVSAVHFTDLCEGLSKSGFAEPNLGASASSGTSVRHTQSPLLGLRVSEKWEVEVWPSNRACHDLKATYTTKPETVNGVTIRRVWRPPFSQHSFLGRILNSIWMLKRWWWRLLLSPSIQPDVILTGTDPLFTIILIPFLKMIRPKAKIVHWCFDLYPEAAIADGMLKENGPVVKLARPFLEKGYAKCDLVADLGPCMREKLKKYGIETPKAEAPSPQPSPLKGEGGADSTEYQKASPLHLLGEKRVVTLTPWALEEPSAPLPIDLVEREALFGAEPMGDASASSGISARPTSPIGLTPEGDKNRRSSPRGSRASGQGKFQLALLYSGNLGRAHDFYLNLKLAQRMRDSAGFTYSVRGSRVDALKLAVNPEYTNIRFAPFAPPERLAARLAAPDVHVVSLRPEWTGTVVPSKFFGALAVGRPVLFEGDEHSSIALWIKEYGVGWVLGVRNMEDVAEELEKFSKDAKKKAEMFKRCHQTYQAHFSKATILSKWEAELRALLP